MAKINKLSIVIPVFNEKNTFIEILRAVEEVDLGNIIKEIIIVDDASFDGTTQLLKELSVKRPDIKFVFKEVNEGKGFALRDGFSCTTGDYVIVQDADLEYDPQDYKRLIFKLSTEAENTVVYGSRFSGDYKDMMTLHYFGNRLVTAITNILYGVSLTDMETCYKLIPGVFIRSMKITAARFNFEPEITAKILRSKMHICEVPISYRGRSHSDGKKLTWRDGFSALVTLVKYRLFPTYE